MWLVPRSLVSSVRRLPLGKGLGEGFVTGVFENWHARSLMHLPQRSKARTPYSGFRCRDCSLVWDVDATKFLRNAKNISHM